MRILVALTSLFFSISAFAAENVPTAPTFVEGRDYEVIAEPVRPLDPSKIEVSEVFFYTCPHCRHFEPLIENWAKRQQPDVKLVQIHTMWSPQMEPYQRGFYTLVTLNVKDKVQLAVFDAVHVQHKELDSAEAWADFLAAFGVDKKQVLDTYNSFGVSSQVKQADARIRGYRVASTPALVIDGKYRISAGLAGGHEAMLQVAQFLVDKIRAERANH